MRTLSLPSCVLARAAVILTERLLQLLLLTAAPSLVAEDFASHQEALNLEKQLCLSATIPTGSAMPEMQPCQLQKITEQSNKWILEVSNI